MSPIMELLDRGLLPDAAIRFGIRRRVAKRLREQQTDPTSTHEQRMLHFIEELRRSPIAIETRAANEQHYELPPGFFQVVLGKHLKYSAGYWDEHVTNLDQAEARMLELYVKRARICDGQDILELGCGWGSLSLYLAQRFPAARILALSNSAPQRYFIEKRARLASLTNIEVITNDINLFETKRRFDRVVSIEMFEHMKNYQQLLSKVAGALRDNGLLFVHIFAHRLYAYHYLAESADDWMARYFFSGGTMPSADLLSRFDDDLKRIDQWAVPGTHYQKTAEAWLENMDANEAAIRELFAKTYGATEVRRWWVRWRVFFMACAEMFGYRKGGEWIVSHELFAKSR